MPKKHFLQMAEDNEKKQHTLWRGWINLIRERKAKGLAEVESRKWLNLKHWQASIWQEHLQGRRDERKKLRALTDNFV